MWQNSCNIANILQCHICWENITASWITEMVKTNHKDIKNPKISISFKGVLTF